MSTFTNRGSVELDSRIKADLEHIAESAQPYSMAGILMGGYGRGEGTPFIHPDGAQSPFNDYDLIVIVEKLTRSLRETLRALETQLTKDLGLTVDLHPYELKGLPHAEFSLLNYELKYGHKVIWGDENILDALPDYSHNQIPLHEGARLLMNRGKLLLDLKIRLQHETPLSEDERVLYIKFIQKVWLALGDSALLSAGKYDLTYSEKKERINEITDGPYIDDIKKGYTSSIALKNWGSYPALQDYKFEQEYKRTQAVFLAYFSWYRTEYRGSECSLLKAIVLNLRYNGRPLPRHPRCYLYDALAELLTDEPCKFKLRQALFSNGDLLERFYWLRARFA